MKTLAVVGAAGILIGATMTPTGARSQVVADEAEKAGIAESTSTWSANVADFDRDGWTDWLLVKHDNSTPPASRLYRNTHHGFTEVNAGTFAQGIDRHDCAWGDANVDGLPDAFCSTGGDLGRGTKLNELWIQRSDHTFVNRAAEFRLTDDIYGRGRSSTFIDANGDRYPDLYVSNHAPRKDEHLSPHRLYINVAGSWFRPAPEYGLDNEIGTVLNTSSCVQAADYDDDGWEDLLVCAKDRLRLFRNERGLFFADVGVSIGIEGLWKNAELVDVDGDHSLDLVRVKAGTLQVKLQKASRFGAPAFILPLEAGENLATGDANGDLRRDIYIVQSCGSSAGNKPDVLLLNDGSAGFVEASIPQTTVGCGNAVAPIDYDRDGRTDFIVLNGLVRAVGPIQLISLR